MKVERKFPEYLKRSNNGGLLVGFIYVLVFMSILFLWIWQTFETENDKSLLISLRNKLILLMRQIMTRLLIFRLQFNF
jgi:hypothetical protein